MKLGAHEKSDRIFKEMYEITKDSFDADEVPPIGVMRQQFDVGDVFVKVGLKVPTPGNVLSFAIVTRRFGLPFIWEIATAKQHRGQGLASSILDEIVEHVRKSGEFGVGLITRIDNPSQTLYFKKGYRVADILRRYYPGKDGLYMKRDVL